MSTFFRSLIDKRSALVYIDDILLLADEKQEMFEPIKELHKIATKENLKLAPEKSFYKLLKVKFLGHEIGNNTIEPIPSKIGAIKKIPSPKDRKDVMQSLGSVNFHSKFIEKLHINLKPLYTLLHDDVKFQWTPELEKIFQDVKNSMTADTELIILNTKHPFFITVDASSVGLGAVLFQMNEENKKKIISYNSRTLNTQEQKLSTLLADEKQEMFELIKELHKIATKENLKLAPEKSFYMLLKVKFLGHEIGNNTIKPIPSKIGAIKKIPSPKDKKDVMQCLGSVNFYSKFIEKLHINLKPLYTLLHDDVKFQWTPEPEKIFQDVKNSMTADTELTILNTKHPFFITVDASSVGLGAVLFQMNKKNKMKIVSYNSGTLNTQEPSTPSNSTIFIRN